MTRGFIVVLDWNVAKKDAEKHFRFMSFSLYRGVGDTMARQRVESTVFIDVQQLLELDKDEIYIFRSKVRDSAVVTIEKACVIDGVRVYFATTRTGFGVRKWFKCPGCACNTKRLYLKSDTWACRTCNQLTYTKSQLSGNEFAYITRKIHELQDELEVTEDNSYSVLGLTAAMIERAPIFKPKYMRWDKFWIKHTTLELMIIKRYELWARMAG